MEFGPLLRAKNTRIRVALNKPAVSTVEARDAIEGCYCVTRYQYVRDHAGLPEQEMAEERLIATMERLYRRTFARLGYDFDHPSRPQLEAVLAFLDEELAWAQIDAALHEHHDQVCRSLIGRVVEPDPADSTPAHDTVRAARPDARRQPAEL